MRTCSPSTGELLPSGTPGRTFPRGNRTSGSNWCTTCAVQAKAPASGRWCAIWHISRCAVFVSGPYAAESDLRQAAALYPDHAGIGWLHRLLAQWGRLFAQQPTVRDLAATLASRAHDAPPSINSGGLADLLPSYYLAPQWDVPTAQSALARVLESHADSVKGVAFSPTGASSPAPAKTAPYVCGTRSPASPPPPSTATPAGCGGWRSHRRPQARQRQPSTAPCACGTPPPDSPPRPSTATPTRSTGWRFHPTGAAGQRQRRRHGAPVGPGRHRPARHDPPGPYRSGQRGGLFTRRACPGQRQRRRHGALVGPGHRPAH